MSSCADNRGQPEMEEAIFEQAVCKENEAERGEFLHQACGANDALRRRVELFLEGHFRGSGFLDSLPEPPSSGRPGDLIGRYQLIRTIGEGGFGVVHLAEQLEPVRRRVALKVIKLGMDTRQVVARFEAERQGLAMMDHPHIAKVLDGGATSAGRPYFVMELVEGPRVTDFCKLHELSIHARLRLFLQVCEAVQHAHQKGIIHRDLKPSNILMGGPDESPSPKVIDFGVAKAVSGRINAQTVVTGMHQLIGTPAYMSPEQASLTGDDIDTRADIYALGTLLYKLLTGAPPFNNHELLTAGIDGMRQIIREREPERPSACRKRLHLSPMDADLDWIVMKCLEKERVRRYETVNVLAEDLRRHLSREPVMARPPTAGYRLQRFVARNKARVGAGAFSLAVLVAATAITARQAIEADRQRTRAEARLKNTLSLLSGTFEKVVPELGNILGATQPRQELAKAAAGIVEDLRRDPHPSDDIRNLLASFYLELSFVQDWLGYNGNTTGQFNEGLQSAQQAIYYSTPGNSARASDGQLIKLCLAEMSAGFATTGLLRFDEAAEHNAKMSRWAEKLAHSQNPFAARRGQEYVTWARQLHVTYLIDAGKSFEALQNYLGPWLSTIRGLAGDPEKAELFELWDLTSELQLTGSAHFELSQFVEADKLHREALTLAELGYLRWPNNVGWISQLGQIRAELAEILLAMGNAKEAEALFDKALKLVETFRQRSPNDPGVTMLHCEILRDRARGFIRWAASDQTSAPDRAHHLDAARKSMEEADRLIETIPMATVQTYLRHRLSPTWAQLGQEGHAAVSRGTSVYKNSPIP